MGWFTVRGMANFVLVAGAWLGGWAWDEVAEGLRSEGHGVYPVTLSGLAERQGADAGQQQHVDDVVAVIEGHDLRDVVLAGHSYSGIPVGQAAGRIGDRLRRVVYVDSNIPHDGKSFIDGWSDEGRAWVEGQMAESGGYWPPLTAEDYVGQDLSDETIALILSRSTPHPGRAITEPAALVTPDHRAADHLHQVPDGWRHTVVRCRRAPRVPVLGAGRAAHRPLADVLPTRSPGKDPQQPRVRARG